MTDNRDNTRDDQPALPRGPWEVRSCTPVEMTDAETECLRNACDDHYPTRNGETVDCLCGVTAIVPTEYEQHRVSAILASARHHISALEVRLDEH